jgi:hypothetical protein
MVVQRAALVSEEDLACMSRKNFNVVGTQRRVRGVVVVDLGAAMAAVVLVVRVLGGHREKGSEDERDRRTRGIGGREGSEDERDRRTRGIGGVQMGRVSRHTYVRGVRHAPVAVCMPTRAGAAGSRRRPDSGKASESTE